MKPYTPIMATMVTAFLFLAVVFVSVTPPAMADECIQKTRSMLYAQPSNTRYNCEFAGKKLMVEDFGRTIPAPEGVYKKLSDGKECFIGKGGFVLYCRL